MRRLIPVVLGMVLLAAGCNTIKAYSDFDPSVDFSRYATFDFIGRPRGLDAFMQQRARAAVLNRLTARGLHRTDTNPDLLVAIVARTRVHRQINTVNWGWGYGWGWYGGIGGATSYVSDVPVGSLVIDLVDARTNQLVWRGLARVGLSADPRRNARILEDAIALIFDRYPPR